MPPDPLALVSMLHILIAGALYNKLAPAYLARSLLYITQSLIKIWSHIKWPDQSLSGCVTSEHSSAGLNS